MAMVTTPYGTMVPLLPISNATVSFFLLTRGTTQAKTYRRNSTLLITIIHAQMQFPASQCHRLLASINAFTISITPTMRHSTMFTGLVNRENWVSMQHISMTKTNAAASQIRAICFLTVCGMWLKRLWQERLNCKKRMATYPISAIASIAI